MGVVAERIEKQREERLTKGRERCSRCHYKPRAAKGAWCYLFKYFYLECPEGPSEDKPLK